MLFNSVHYLIFLPITFGLYWIVSGLRSARTIQNVLLLVASYIFYGWWDYRFLALLVFSTLLDYLTGIRIYRASTTKTKKVWLTVSVLANLGVLGFFKYYNFFIDSMASVLESFGVGANPWTLSIILPVGISFYTFHGLSYVFDIYNDRISPSFNLVDYCLFVCFFPLLVAGPIERANHLLPQIQRARTFDGLRAADGLRQILWGVFKKVVIADNCAEHVNSIFANSQQYDGGVLILGAVLFAFQIYGDFSGYSDIALGSARLFGFELLRNFAFPYFSRDIAEFWRRWHISLTSWFRDYLYIPLGGSRNGTRKAVRNTFIVFIVSGLWHGANWTFVVWGGLNAVFFLPLLLAGKNRIHLDIVARGRTFPTLWELGSIVRTFALTTFAWIFFRSDNVGDAFSYVKTAFLGLWSGKSYSELNDFIHADLGMSLPILLMVLLIIEWQGREHEHALQWLRLKVNRRFRWLFYYGLILLLFLFAGTGQDFIYFQF